MSQTSPSSRKVDDFLSKISQISQERLRENNQTQTQLQNDIDILRRSNSANSSPYKPRPAPGFEVKQLTFNRSARSQFRENWKDATPPLPTRPSVEPYNESPPAMPARPKPMIPTKPQLLRPEPQSGSARASRAEPEIKPSLPKRPTFRTEPLAVRKSNVAVQQTFELPNYVARKPSTSGASGSLDSNLTKASGSPKTSDSVSTKPPTPKKPTTLSRIAGKTPAPPKPVKPTLRSFESDDTQQLKDQISRLSPTKTKQQSYKLQNESLQTSVSRFSPAEVLKPSKPVKPKTLAPKPEALDALSRLKKAPAQNAASEAIPEALQKLESIRKAKPQLPSKPTSTPAPKPSTFGSNNTASNLTIGGSPFQEKLSGILRASTDPGLGANPPKTKVLERASTDLEPTSGKISHPNKTRAKGPKRKLPKSISKGEPTSKPKADDNYEDLSQKSGPRVGAATDSQPLPKPRKIPPAKGKKPDFIAKPSRNFSGELFI